MSTDPPELTTDQVGGQTPVASIDAITMLVHSFGAMIGNMERRITERITDNAAASKERWERWERDFEKYRDQTDKRITILEASVHEHHTREEQREIAFRARVGPLRAGFGWAWDHWRDIVLLLIGLFALFTFLAELATELAS